MSPENFNPLNSVSELSRRLDEETRLMSGGFDRLDAFQEIIEQGENALCELVAAIDNVNWWRLQAIWTIAYTIGKPIEYPEDIQGYYDDVSDYTIIWAIANGYINEEPDSYLNR